jgi:magnesium transporter
MSAESQPLPGITWYDLDEPKSPALDELAKRFQLHPLQIEDVRHRPQPAKTDEYGKYIFSILKHLKHPKQKNEKFAFDDFDVFLGPNFLITIHEGECHLIDKVRKLAQQTKLDRLDRIFYHLIDETVDEYVAALDDIAEDVSDVESKVLEHPEPPVLREIFQLKRRLIGFRRIASGMREVVNALIRREKGMIGDDLDPYFRDVYDHLIRTVDLIETYRDLLTGSLDIYLSAVANRTNEVMKILTIWGTVALPLVIITGFFGMNLPLPWEHRPHGTWLAVGLMAVSTLLVLMYFKRKHWF